MRIDQTGGGDQCPACGECDLRPYGNGSKWACPRCHFILPCCEVGELAGLPAAGRRSGALTDSSGAAAFELSHHLPPHSVRSADEVRFVTATIGLCGPIPRTNHGQTIKKA